MNIKLIAAVDIENGIGLNGTIPWRLKEDMAFFKEKTTNRVVIMGRRTFASLNFKPLPNRMNIVISSTLQAGNHHPKEAVNGYLVCPTLKLALDYLRPFMTYEENSISNVASNTDVYIIGGTALYEEAMPLADEIFLTCIYKDFGCDTSFPSIPNDFDLVGKEPHQGPDFNYSFLTFKRNK